MSSHNIRAIHGFRPYVEVGVSNLVDHSKRLIRAQFTSEINSFIDEDFARNFGFDLTDPVYIRDITNTGPAQVRSYLTQVRLDRGGRSVVLSLRTKPDLPTPLVLGIDASTGLRIHLADGIF